MSMSVNTNYKTLKNKKINSVNNFIENNINNLIINDNDNDIDYDNEIDILEKEFESKYKSNINLPKKYGNMWNDDERFIILQKIKKNNYINNDSLFDEKVIKKICSDLERTEYGVKEEIKKMIYNDYILGNNYASLSIKYNIPTQNIKLLLKLYMEKNGNKIINTLENENKILRLQIENIKLKKELKELNNL